MVGFGLANGELIEMRMLLFGAVAGMALLAGGDATAQTRVGGPDTARRYPGAYPAPASTTAPRTSRWGSRVDGRWWGGSNAPGGWSAYRRPARGYALPTYWIAPRFAVNDWSTYGLSTPPQGYHWSRYYDDAVLIDTRGSVYDSVTGLDWDGLGGPAYTAATYPAPAYPAPVDAGRGYDDGRYSGGYSDGYGADYPPPPAYDRSYDADRSSGLGGAAVGAVAGGVAGNLIAGRGNRLGGTLIGAGVGAAAGYAVDKSQDRRRRRPPVAPYSAEPYPPAPYAGYGADYAGPNSWAGPNGWAGPNSWTSPDGATTVVTTSSGGYYGGGTTTVTVQSAPVVTTTTTTDVYEDRVTYSRPVAHKVYRKRRASRPRCYCR
ncbi:Glycine zipper 2TM domain-containing protein [Sphingomonas gellani]|uniref:17 kDa surface antigen n=2 Tax=Sphingomonas gellani TaxID=1166340 RepID=A0A1H8FTZ7_9SPHN|nr:Glycine zipper 2TM domain-containing protein [Sphingomonas gellani]